MRVIVDSLFLPPLEFFCQLISSDGYYFNSDAPFVKQSFRNRCFILGPHKIEQLTVPIVHHSKHTNIANVKLSFAEPWQRNCWRTIENCYRKSPFFEYYSPYFKSILLECSTDSLMILNNELLKICLKLLQINVPYCHEKHNDFVYKSINYKKSGIFGRDYQAIAYNQNFGNDFVPNLSIIDLLFCKGPESLQILKKSTDFEHKD